MKTLEAKLFYFGNKILRCCDIPLPVHPKRSQPGWFLPPDPTGLVLAAGIDCTTTPCKSLQAALSRWALPCAHGQRFWGGAAASSCHPKEMLESNRLGKALTAMLSLMVCPSLKPRSSLGPCSRSWACRASSLCCLTHLQELNPWKRRRHSPPQAPPDK